MPEELRELVTDQLAWNRSLRVFRRYGLVEVNEGALVMHRLVQAVTRDRLAADERQAWAAADHAEAMGVALQTTSALLDRVMGYLYAQGRYEEAIPLGERALRLDEEVLDANHPTVAIRLNNIATLYRAQGRYEDAEPLYVRCLAILEATLGPDHPNTRQGHLNYAACNAVR